MAAEVALLNNFLLDLNDRVSHLSNFRLPCIQIFNRDDTKGIIENGVKIQGLNWKLLKFRDQIENTPKI